MLVFSVALTSSNQDVQLLNHRCLEVGKVTLVVGIVEFGVAVTFVFQSRAIVLALHHVEEDRNGLLAQLLLRYHAHFQYWLHQLRHKLGFVLPQLEPHLPDLHGRILADVTISCEHNLPFIIVEIIQLKRGLHQKGNRALEEVRPDLFLERAQEVVRNDHGEVLQSTKDHSILVHNHVHPVPRKHCFLVRRHQLLKYQKDLYDKVFQLAALVQVLHKVLVVLGVHALQYTQHNGKEFAHQSRVPVQGVSCLHHSAEQDDHNVSNVIVRGTHIRSEQKFQYVVHDVDALGNLTMKVDILNVSQIIIFNPSNLGMPLENSYKICFITKLPKIGNINR